MVQRQKLLLDRLQNKAENHRTSDRGLHSPVFTDGSPVQAASSFMFLCVQINSLLIFVHQLHPQGDSAEGVHPAETEELWVGNQNPGETLPMHHSEHPNWMHCGVVW